MSLVHEYKISKMQETGLLLLEAEEPSSVRHQSCGMHRARLWERHYPTHPQLCVWRSWGATLSGEVTTCCETEKRTYSCLTFIYTSQNSHDHLAAKKKATAVCSFFFLQHAKYWILNKYRTVLLSKTRHKLPNQHRIVRLLHLTSF